MRGVVLKLTFLVALSKKFCKLCLCIFLELIVRER
jgi:hypothetical protein